MFQRAKAAANRPARVALIVFLALCAGAAFIQFGPANAATIKTSQGSAAKAVPSSSSSSVAALAPSPNYQSYCESGDEARKYEAFETFSLSITHAGHTSTFDKAHLIAMSRDIASLVHAGDKVSITFELTARCANTYVAIDVYGLPSDNWVQDQQRVQRQGALFGAGKQHTLSVTLPSYCFQLDIYTGIPYTPGDRPGNTAVEKHGRMLLFAIPKWNCPAFNTPTTAPTTVPPTTMAPTTTTPPTTVTPAAVEPTATARQVCLPDIQGWSVTYANKNAADQQFEMTANGTKVIETVKGGQELTKEYTFAGFKVPTGGAVKVDIQANGKSIVSKSFTNDCFLFTVDVDVTCPTASVNITSDGKLDESLAILRNGTPVEGSPVNLGADHAVRVPVSLNNGETTEIKVLGAKSGYTFTKKVTMDCPVAAKPPVPPAPVQVQVLNEQVNAPQALAAESTLPAPTLAKTGADPKPEIALGFLLLALGGALWGAGRRYWLLK